MPKRKPSAKLNLLLIVLIALISYSCSDDDVAQTESPRSISKLKLKIYNSNEVERYSIRDYENNRPKTDSFYNNNHELTSYFDWIYEYGMLTDRKGYSANGTLIFNVTISYDNMNRIIQTTNSSNASNIITTDFTYNSDNTISSRQENNSGFLNKTFYINTLGLIHKELNDDGTSEVIYDADNNVIRKTESGVTNYSYDNVNLPPDNFPVNENFMFGDYKNNRIIYNNSINAATYNEASTLRKFGIGYQSGTNVVVIDWVLDSDNYPISKKFYSDNQLQIEYEYTYE
ncbi:hypothetical protein [Bizionia sp.]|uniref:hypothetical protein n=1 Tax=Bizionia sp. TaxID=1954480 RepID=UPI003A94ADE5